MYRNVATTLRTKLSKMRVAFKQGQIKQNGGKRRSYIHDLIFIPQGQL